MISIPEELTAREQWVCYRLEERGGKLTKVPYRADRGGRVGAKSNDPSTWCSFGEALEAAGGPENRLDGIGFMLSEEDPYVFIDLDHVAVDGQVEPWACNIIDCMNSYAEISQSDTGVHIIIRATKPGPRCRTNDLPGVEIYDNRRLVVFTGKVCKRSLGIITNAQKELDRLYSQMFGDRPQIDPAKRKSRAHKAVDRNEQELLKLAKQARNGAKFQSLWQGNIAEYNADSSAADMALCCMLAYWADKDPARIDNLFRQSGLMRDKWDEYRGSLTYGEKTVNAAIEATKSTYSQHKRERRAKSIVRGSGNPGRLEAVDGPDGEPMNDLGNARRLVTKHGENIRFCHDAGKWYCWDSKRWIKDATSEIVRKAKDVVDDMYRQALAMRSLADSQGDSSALDAAKAFERHAVASGNHRRILAMISQAQSEPGITILAGDLDADPWAFNCANGTLDLRYGVLRAHSRADLISKITKINYNPAAECPMWEKFIGEVFVDDEELVEFVHRACGYTLTGDTREQLFFILHGCGSNGKSTFITVLREILGDYETKTTTDTLVEKQNHSNTNDLAALRGARLVSTIETSPGKRLAETLVKELTGQDAVTARFLYQEFFTFVPVFKLWLACNHVPIIQGQENAIWRRIRLIPFSVQFQDAEHPSGPYKDKSLPEKLRSEYEGILAWLVRGCSHWQESGLTSAKAVQSATGKLQQDMDVLGGFLDECCVLEASAQSTAKELYSAYCNWAEFYGEKLLSQRWFGVRLTERGTCEKSKGTNGVRSWKGVRLIDTISSGNLL